MGRNKIFGKNLPERKRQDRYRKRQTTQSRRLSRLLDSKEVTKLGYGGIRITVDLQNACEKNPERLLKIEGFGPVTVNRICKKVGVIVPLGKLKKNLLQNKQNIVVIYHLHV